jgi:hypothetical protein
MSLRVKRTCLVPPGNRMAGKTAPQQQDVGIAVLNSATNHGKLGEMVDREENESTNAGGLFSRNTPSARSS